MVFLATNINLNLLDNDYTSDLTNVKIYRKKRKINQKLYICIITNQKKQIAIMKKVLFFLPMLMIGLLFTSCSSDDDDSTTTDSIVGTWKLTSESINSNNLKMDFTFNADGTLVSTYYETINGVETSKTVTGIWKNLGKGVYSVIDANGDTSIINFSSDKRTIEYRAGRYMEGYASEWRSYGGSRYMEGY